MRVLRSSASRCKKGEGGLLLQNNDLDAIKYCTSPHTEHLIPSAYVRQCSGRHLDLLNPNFEGWEDEDLAIDLSRTYRCGGHSTWPLPLSVAQHSLTVLKLCKSLAIRSRAPAEMLRELLHDADEALIGGFDPISPLESFLEPGYAQIVSNLQAAVFKRYGISDWTPSGWLYHKRADLLAGAA